MSYSKRITELEYDNWVSILNRCIKSGALNLSPGCDDSVKFQGTDFLKFNREFNWRGKAIGWEVVAITGLNLDSLFNEIINFLIQQERTTTNSFMKQLMTT